MVYKSVQTSSSTTVRQLAAPAPVALAAIEIRLLRLRLVRPFETSFDRLDSRLIMLTRIEADGVEGWGEIVALEEPLFSYETVETAREIIKRHFAPALLHGTITSLDDLVGRLRHFRGHPMAKAGIELAWLDLIGRLRQQPITTLIGGTRARVDVGVSLGIERTREALLAIVDEHVALGYQRIKLKIKPGWDVDVVEAVRQRHPTITLSVDANAAYTLADCAHLRRLDQFKLLMIEQPLGHNDLVDHARLQGQIETAICLDESIGDVHAAQQALSLGSCRIINIKIGRVGGYSAALGIHDLCLSLGVPVWCGGMLESGIGRAHNLALASLPGFTLPGDISASARYWTRDIITPPVTVAADGTVIVPIRPGIGIDLDRDYLHSETVAIDRHERS
jgi:O-succinylbenzoate synthase